MLGPGSSKRANFRCEFPAFILLDRWRAIVFKSLRAGSVVFTRCPSYGVKESAASRGTSSKTAKASGGSACNGSALARLRRRLPDGSERTAAAAAAHMATLNGAARLGRRQPRPGLGPKSSKVIGATSTVATQCLTTSPLDPKQEESARRLTLRNCDTASRDRRGPINQGYVAAG